MSEDVIKAGNGLWDQILIPNGLKIDLLAFVYEEKKTTLITSEVADYSIFVKRNLSDVKAVRIKTKSMDKWLTTKEIMATPSGSVLYFEDKVGDIFRNGCIYPAKIYTNFRRNHFLDWPFGKKSFFKV